MDIDERRCLGQHGYRELEQPPYQFSDFIYEYGTYRSLEAAEVWSRTLCGMKWSVELTRETLEEEVTDITNTEDGPVVVQLRLDLPSLSCWCNDRIHT